MSEKSQMSGPKGRQDMYGKHPVTREGTVRRRLLAGRRLGKTL